MKVKSMSTIVVDEWGEVAWDSMLTEDGHKSDAVIPKVLMCRKALWGVIGDVSAAHFLLQEHIRTGEDIYKLAEKVSDQYDWQLLKLPFDYSAVMLFTDPEPWGAPMKTPFAIGTGKLYATGAMAAGADAGHACEIAARFDNSTGGTIYSVNLHEIKTSRLNEHVPLKELRDTAGRPIPRIG